ncbi:MAG: 2-hydroxyacyl-CoA dehydratase, partial [Desulfobacterota bacterium]|nr:2-hydroxyacyl-CoA dehydratase [Thermodesulfobacteriota bacterium]
DRPLGLPLEELVIYEMHVRGFTRHPSSAVRFPGTYAGVREKIPHLVELGVNCVELLPIFEFDETELDRFVHEAQTRSPREGSVRLGYLGVPPIFSDLYESIESMGARVVFNEVQRQFSMPFEGEDLIDQYLNYTYPYGLRARLEDIRKAVAERKLDGLIHYTQTFCFRQIYDILLREGLRVPMLTIEGDKPGKVDSRTAIRLETFVEMLRMKKGDQWF